ncbi:cytochrome o ubiquinol oxidase subunit III [Candidatus Saccharibacteria bacterium]|nr:cytochrome o ubiquinol oxidase subunit III [Candidatus Saccharibacteria bacterium]
MKQVIKSTQSVEASPAIFGFWLYLMTDCLVFASLFASFVVLRGQTAGGVGSKEIFSLPFVFLETMVLLVSSLTSGMALLAAQRQKRQHTLMWLTATALLGMLFLGLELYEFSSLVQEGHSWTQSAFLSSYFGLVGTHGIHIAIGLIWLFATMLFIYKRGLTHRLMQRLTMFILFWHFLDIVWVCIFTIVYLIGVI